MVRTGKLGGLSISTTRTMQISRALLIQSKVGLSQNTKELSPLRSSSSLRLSCAISQVKAVSNANILCVPQHISCPIGITYLYVYVLLYYTGVKILDQILGWGLKPESFSHLTNECFAPLLQSCLRFFCVQVLNILVQKENCFLLHSSPKQAAAKVHTALAKKHPPIRSVFPQACVHF